MCQPEVFIAVIYLIRYTVLMGVRIQRFYFGNLQKMRLVWSYQKKIFTKSWLFLQPVSPDTLAWVRLECVEESEIYQPRSKEECVGRSDTRHSNSGHWSRSSDQLELIFICIWRFFIGTDETLPKIDGVLPMYIVPTVPWV